MYSSSPNIIKHFVSLSYSKQAVDYTPSARTKVIPQQNNPFTNKKLQQSSLEKDYVLIFTNKTNKLFQPRKALRKRYISQKIFTEDIGLRNIKREITQVEKKLYKDDEFIHRKTAMTAAKTYRTNPLKTETRNLQDTRPKLFSSLNTRKRSGFQTVNTKMSLKEDFSEMFQAINFGSLKIQGTKAPDCEMVDHLKRHSIETQSINKLK